ncbi:hypothetical protein Tcan_01671, partial [Toxocara canis]
MLNRASAVAGCTPDPISFVVLPKRAPSSIVSAPAPRPKPTPLGPYLRPWHCLQNSSEPCSATVHESLDASHNLRHFDLSIAELLSGIHSECTSSDTKPNTFWAILPSVTLFTVQFRLMLTTVHRIQQFIAHRYRLLETLTTFEAELVEFITTGYHFLGCVDRFTALRALGVFDRLERHCVLVTTINTTSCALPFCLAS